MGEGVHIVCVPCQLRTIEKVEEKVEEDVNRRSRIANHVQSSNGSLMLATGVTRQRMQQVKARKSPTRQISDAS